MGCCCNRKTFLEAHSWYHFLWSNIQPELAGASSQKRFRISAILPSARANRTVSHISAVPPIDSIKQIVHSLIPATHTFSFLSKKPMKHFRAASSSLVENTELANGNIFWMSFRVEETSNGTEGFTVAAITFRISHSSSVMGVSVNESSAIGGDSFKLTLTDLWLQLDLRESAVEYFASSRPPLLELRLAGAAGATGAAAAGAVSVPSPFDRLMFTLPGGLTVSS
mmetsp:Transcript_24547/g.48317  ORF Transcript_24547/g.48317 Transcript_24547/m.48317 type:complete len:225 (+) Transcript_24547:308-982(+)